MEPICRELGLKYSTQTKIAKKGCWSLQKYKYISTHTIQMLTFNHPTTALYILRFDVRISFRLPDVAPRTYFEVLFFGRPPHIIEEQKCKTSDDSSPDGNNKLHVN